MENAITADLGQPQKADILIVDDTIENLVFLAEVLESQGYRVRKARNGELALRAVTTVVPDLILLDIRLPDLSGYEVCRRLKQHPATAPVPVIFLSALTDVVAKVKAFEAGGADYISKPFQMGEVLARTQHQLTIQAAVKTVWELNQQLETKVRLRTQQLESANDQLRQMAYHDSLTRLPNRARLKECLWQSLEALQQDAEHSFALMFLDCDRFKLVNDSFGHAAGDALLVEVSQRLSACLGPNDTLARFGGDEFVVLTHGIAGIEEAQTIAQSLLDALAPSFQLAEGEIYISASIGIVISDAAHHERPEHLLRDADAAMYSAKAHGKNCYRLFSPALQQNCAHLLQVETELHRALKRQELVPYYQPIVDLQSLNIVGAEMLCRWHHPERGVLLPQEFIPVAEETQLIVDIGQALLEDACAQLRQWQQQRLVDDEFYLSVNLSARELAQVNLPDAIAASLARHHLQPHHLRLEITESGVLNNDIALQVMEELSQRQIGLSIDDFGTGYSSLSYLHQLPVSTLKIDRAFIHNLNHNPQNASVVTAILGLAKTFNLEIIAEGIDDPSQVECLLQMNCALFGQGYWFARPLPADDMQNLLAENCRFFDASARLFRIISQEPGYRNSRLSKVHN